MYGRSLGDRDALPRRHTMAPFLSAVHCATTQDRLHITGGQSKRSSCCVQFLGSTQMRATCRQHLTEAATARPQLAAPSPSSRSLFPGNDRDHARRVQCPQHRQTSPFQIQLETHQPLHLLKLHGLAFGNHAQDLHPRLFLGSLTRRSNYIRSDLMPIVRPALF
jgi:hypothetical protein